jgi:hypothetical protein
MRSNVDRGRAAVRVVPAMPEIPGVASTTRVPAPTALALSPRELKAFSRDGREYVCIWIAK